ncbi:MAG TPA: hypothetical protein DCY35_08040 [Prolixibacteraceae bacterium]|nr:hypothetical protein [Prolixibacteraceae bacterium]
MNDHLEPDFAMLQKASQARQNCEDKETRLKKKRNILLIIFLLCSTLTIGLKISISSLGLLSQQFKLVAEHYLLWLISAISILILATAIYFIFNLMSAHTETEKARKNEWKLLLYLNRQLSRRAI